MMEQVLTVGCSITNTVLVCSGPGTKKRIAALRVSMWKFQVLVF